MATTLYLVRHGQTEYNRLHIVQGRKINSDLNARGIEQAERLAERLSTTPLDAFYASPLRRCVQTAAAVHRYHPLAPIHLLPDLEEMSWGDLEGLPDSDYTRTVFREMYERWRQGDFDARVPGGESIREVADRAMRAFRRIVTNHADGTVLVVAHGRLLRVLLASVLPHVGLTRMQEIQHANTSVNCVVVEDGVAEAQLLNCTAHLEDVTSTLIE